jgi:hypothetical protein
LSLFSSYWLATVDEYLSMLSVFENFEDTLFLDQSTNYTGFNGSGVYFYNFLRDALYEDRFNNSFLDVFGLTSSYNNDTTRQDMGWGFYGSETEFYLGGVEVSDFKYLDDGFLAFIRKY